MSTGISSISNHDEPENGIKLDRRSLELRRVIVRMLESGGRGHVGSAFSLVEIIRVLYDEVMQYDPRNPDWAGRDRFILSKGQGCLALYPILAEKGYFPEAELWKFCKLDGLLGGHPEIKIPGVEASTGSLGHGLSIGIGLAINAKIEKESYRCFVVIGDGECDEGSVWEAALSASKHRLSNLTVIVDYNKQQSYGTTFEVQDLEPLVDKWKSFGFSVAEVDGHDVSKLGEVLSKLPFHPDKPNAIICHTIKGKGVPYVENNLEWHHKNRITAEEVKSLIEHLVVGT